MSDCNSGGGHGEEPHGVLDDVAPLSSLGPLEQAIVLAVQAHAGQCDSDGSPYVLHPLRVMARLGAGASAEQRMAAVLHDVLEQTSLTEQDLLQRGFAPQVVQAVRVLTRPEWESRLAATQRAAADPIACAVKRADILDNMDWARIPDPQPADHARMAEYRQALAWLDAHERDA
ncbi:HD domain-containing protein [Vandammella animalimorsus]|uniref:HD domain-containing protein n=1 Tax=Vandammella animalimorsus TaxID=2029117 RepID=UPI001EEF1EBA|nr:HD domain-containing protein [Vandammella animalimorsus]